MVLISGKEGDMRIVKGKRKETESMKVSTVELTGLSILHFLLSY